MASVSLHPRPSSVPEFAGAPLKGPSDYLGFIALADRLISAGQLHFAAAALDDAERAMEGHPERARVQAWAADLRAEARRRAIMSGSLIVSGTLE